MNLTVNQALDALIVVDMQVDFYYRYGALYVKGGEELIEPIARLMNEFHTVVLTQDWHPAGHISFASTHKLLPFDKLTLHGHEHTLWPEHCVRGSFGAELARDIGDHKHVSMILRKGADWRVDSYSAFKENWGPGERRRDTGLMSWLLTRGLRRVFICGLARDVCVLATGVDAAVDGGAALQPQFLWDYTRAVDGASDVETRRRLLEAGCRIVEGVLP